MKIKTENQTAEPTATPETGTGMQIVVLDRGWVYVGVVSFEADNVVIRNARNIRRWGTTKGLGQLVNGPTKATVVDLAGEVTAPKKSVIHFIKCNRGW